MSAVTKCLILVVALFCFMQLVEMAKIEKHEDRPLEKELNELTEVGKKVVERLEGAIDEDTKKKLISAFENAFKAVNDLAAKGLHDLSQQMAKMNKP